MRKSRTRAKLKAARLIPDFSGKMERVYERVKIQQLECEMPRVPATERWNMYPEICRMLLSAFASHIDNYNRCAADRIAYGASKCGSGSRRYP